MRPDLSRPQWNEQDGHQPPGEALCDERCGDHRRRARGPAPCRQAPRNGEQHAGGRGWRRHQPGRRSGGRAAQPGGGAAQVRAARLRDHRRLQGGRGQGSRLDRFTRHAHVAAGGAARRAAARLRAPLRDRVQAVGERGALRGEDRRGVHHRHARGPDQVQPGQHPRRQDPGLVGAGHHGRARDVPPPLRARHHQGGARRARGGLRHPTRLGDDRDEGDRAAQVGGRPQELQRLGGGRAGEDDQGDPRHGRQPHRVRPGRRRARPPLLRKVRHPRPQVPLQV
mmetsp:Transcript_14088/g.44262  ORF Transcript_14088/g.44262 Transcript_14088/m.44262 type:complete len:282 (-) Transcript_14088:1366-2211(-)